MPTITTISWGMQFSFAEADGRNVSLSTLATADALLPNGIGFIVLRHPARDNVSANIQFGVASFELSTKTLSVHWTGDPTLTAYTFSNYELYRLV